MEELISTRDRIEWFVPACESESCPLDCKFSTELDAVTGEKTQVSKLTVCPECYAHIRWELRDLMNTDGEWITLYCHGYKQ